MLLFRMEYEDAENLISRKMEYINSVDALHEVMGHTTKGVSVKNWGLNIPRKIALVTKINGKGSPLAIAWMKISLFKSYYKTDDLEW